MAEFISDLPEIASGGIGGQRIVATPQPDINKALNQSFTNVRNVAETLGTIYSENKASAMVSEELENLDHVANAARTASQTTGIMETVPESVKGYEREFTLMKRAYENGGLSREKMQILAGARVRDAIRQEPLLSRQIRQAAEGVLGFNIESLEAQTYFGAFPTSEQLNADSSGPRTQREEWWDTAEAVAPSMGVSTQMVYDQIAEDYYVGLQKDIASNQLDMGQINTKDYLTKFDQVDSTTAFGNLIGQIKNLMATEGKVDNVALSGQIKLAKMQALNQAKTAVRKIGGSTNTPEFARFEERLNERYQGYEEYIEHVGVDNLTEVNLKRFSNAQKVLGNRLIPQIMFLTETVGAEMANNLLDVFQKVRNPQQLKLMFDAFPGLENVYEAMGSDANEFSKLLYGTQAKIVTGGLVNLTEEEAEVVDAAFQMAYQDADEKGKGDIFAEIVAHAPTKGLSFLVQGTPNQVTAKEREWFSYSYNTELPGKMDKLVQTIMPTMDFFDVSIVNGRIEVEYNRILPRGSRRGNSNTVPNVSDLEESINFYADGLDKGWGKVVGQDAVSHNRRMEELYNEALERAKAQRDEDSVSTLVSHIRSGNDDAARALYSELRESNPGRFTATYEELRAEARRRSGLPAVPSIQ